MSNGLKQYFPMIQTREELCKKIQTTPELVCYPSRGQ